MLITAYEADVVEFHPNGEVTSVPLSDCYLHQCVFSPCPHAFVAKRPC